MKNWQTKKLGEICSLIKGKKPEKFYTSGKAPYLTAGVIRGTEMPVYTNTDDPSSVWVNKEDLVIIMDGSNSGEMFTHLEGALASTMGIVNFPKDLLSSVYLLHFFETHRENFTKSRTGSAIPHLNKEQFENLEISFPILSEQKRIVKILDEIFKNIDKAKDNTEKNLQNSKEIFETYSQKAFENPGNWDNKTLGEVCSLYQGIAINAKTKHALVEKSNLPLLRIKDLRNNTVEQYIDPNNYPKNALVNESDLIYTRTGQIGLVFTGKRGVLHNNSFKIVPTSVLSREYLFYWLQNPTFKEKIITLASRAAQPDITHVLFKQQTISIPSLAVQKQIVKKLDELSKQTKKLEENYKQKLLLLDEFKKSVLAKAFAGEL